MNCSQCNAEIAPDWKVCPFCREEIRKIVADVPASGWSAAQPMKEARFNHTASLLGDGKVLVTGGQQQIYDGDLLALGEDNRILTSSTTTHVGISGSR